MRVDVMVDIETLGKRVDDTIFQVAAIAFDINTGAYLNEFNQVADIGKAKDIQVQGETLKWWLETDKELLTKLLSSGTVHPTNLLVNLSRWIQSLGNINDIYLWGNGILFDNKILQHQMQSNNIFYPIYYRNDRDMSTIVDLASAKLGVTVKELQDLYRDDTLKKHDAFDDVKFQINIVSKCYNLLKGSVIIVEDT